jgi:hypothetical protein
VECSQCNTRECYECVVEHSANSQTARYRLTSIILTQALRMAENLSDTFPQTIRRSLRGGRVKGIHIAKAQSHHTQ